MYLAKKVKFFKYVRLKIISRTFFVFDENYLIFKNFINSVYTIFSDYLKSFQHIKIQFYDKVKNFFLLNK